MVNGVALRRRHAVAATATLDAHAAWEAVLREDRQHDDEQDEQDGDERMEPERARYGGVARRHVASAPSAAP
jgi:hypothetical protein